MSEDGPAFGNFKLSLQSAVCHRGNSVSSGHYISLVRSQEQDTNPLNGSGEAKWMRLDDLAKERVALVNVQDFLRKESPYLLFYQVQPIEGDPGNLADNLRSPDSDGPPSYAVSESRDSGTADPALSAHGSLDISADSLNLNKPIETISSREQGERLSTQNVRSQSSLLPHNTLGNFTQPSVLPANGSIYLAAYHEDLKPNHPNSRGRPISDQNQDKRRLSRSLSRLAGRLTKDKIPDGPSRMAVVGSAADNALNSQAALEIPARLPPSTSEPDISQHARLKKENSIEKQKHKNGHQQQATKEKQKTQKLERECNIM